ncbi:LexA family transcriptional regulator [Leclercia sp.]|uniref:LexA family protein n=1 Tax=Leclercia sp. TaxID=1898428 RepID=UPI0028AC29E3|nr:LexA family transcriptional regulator [Leclercia sp.]
MKTLSMRQQEVLDLLVDYQKEHGFPPTVSELAGLMGCSSQNSARDILLILQRKGAITITPGVSRGITITRQQSDDEAIAIIRALLIGDESAREQALTFLEIRGVEL